MTAAERTAIKILIDRAKRAKLVADGIRAGHGARLHGDIAIGQARKRGAIPMARTRPMNGSRRPYAMVADDEQVLQAMEIEHGVSHDGYMLPSQRGTRVAA
jgi:hypothetical protein